MQWLVDTRANIVGCTATAKRTVLLGQSSEDLAGRACGVPLARRIPTGDRYTK